MALVRIPALSDFSGAFHELERFKKQMDRLFLDRGGFGLGRDLVCSGVYPAMNISEDADKIYVQAELPGIQGEDLDVSVEGNTLTLRGERKIDVAEDVAYHRRERTTGWFRKSVTLPGDVDPSRVEANFKNGRLFIAMPKAEHAKPRKIEIKAA